ncbi:diaminopimelate epimerase [Peribacillus deserti]|uniref:Diaminopimelate epimerase n=1 Tax=Peribacillus deserti TaxID=673318 RepID=A0ABS2QH81_9BACI|nr:diaminopimelate epimerase [Peribacillus deserti]MBM7692499.1 diaminopimelate epimerase [Peribacillus deserti]
MNIEIIKCHGSGNDFILIDEMDTLLPLTEDERASLAVAICSRGSEIGGDGILFVQGSAHADAKMRIFNSDGSEASMCGNGLRCVARYACEKLGSDKLVIETMKADLEVERTEDIFDGIPTFRVEISPVSFQLKDLPLHLEQDVLLNEKIPQLSNDLYFTAVAVPNPHLIAIVDQGILASDVQETLSIGVNKPNTLFPDGVNVSFVRLLEKNHIFVRTFERGVGYTNACGTAMSASSLVTCLHAGNEPEKEISVYNNGGKVKCVVHHMDGETKIDLIGNGTYEYKAALQFDSMDFTSVAVLNKEEFNTEKELYAKLQDEVAAYLTSFN